jgi:excinuclease ABC subunit A
MHAITAETWLLKLKFRVPRKHFTKQQLLSVVSLPTLNEVDEIESYGNEPRVAARAAGTWMELEMRVFSLSEIDKPAFWNWLELAMSSFLDQTQSGAPGAVSSVESQMPWKVLGQRWHTLRKGFPPGREVLWPPETLSVLVQVVHQTLDQGRWRWDEPSTARFMLPDREQPWITVHTKRPEGLIVMLEGPPLEKLSDLVAGMPVPVNWTNRSETSQQLQMAFTETLQPRDTSFRRLLSAHLKALTGAKTSS